MNGTLASNLIVGSQRLDTLAGEVVTYKRGTQSTTWTARPAAPDWVMVLDNGIVEEWEGIDFIGQAALLLFSSVAVTPARGDTITRADGTVYQVLSPKGKQVYDVTAYGETIHIHTKQVVS